MAIEKQAERSADQAVFSNQKGFQAGTRTLIDILNAQQHRLNTRRDLAQARYQYIMARVRLQGLVGAINEGEITVINSWLSDSGRGATSMFSSFRVERGTPQIDLSTAMTFLCWLPHCVADEVRI